MAVVTAGARSFRWLARVGLAARGIVYLLMGILALLVALGQRRGGLGDQRHAVQTLRTVPGGRVLLGLVAIGLAGYSLLRIAQGVFDTEHKGTDAKGVLRRIAYFVDGLFYTGIVAFAGHAAWSGHDGPTAQASRASQRGFAGRVLHWPGGAYLLDLAGLIVLGAGVFTLYKAASSRFMKDIDLSAVSDARRGAIRRAGQLGYAARGIVMGIVGSFFLHAGHTARSSDMGSTKEALDVLAKMGPVVLGAVASGLVAYGLYSFVEALYARQQ